MERRVALLAAYHKKPELINFARWIYEHQNYHLIASGGTAQYIRKSGLPVQDVADLTGGKPILGHRVVTLSREIAAALLCRRDNPGDMDEMNTINVRPIDLVFVDLYPLEKAIADPNATRESVIEMTDIGGPTLLRAAAKGRRIVISGYDCLAEFMPIWLKRGLPENDAFAVAVLDRLAKRAEETVRDYCNVSASSILS